MITLFYCVLFVKICINILKAKNNINSCSELCSESILMLCSNWDPHVLLVGYQLGVQ